MQKGFRVSLRFQKDGPPGTLELFSPYSFAKVGDLYERLRVGYISSNLSSNPELPRSSQAFLFSLLESFTPNFPAFSPFLSIIRIPNSTFIFRYIKLQQVLHNGEAFFPSRR